MDDRRWEIEGENGWLSLQELQDRFRSTPLGETRIHLVGSETYLTQENVDALISESYGGQYSTPPQPGAGYVQPVQPEIPANENPLRFVVPLNPSIWAIASGYLGLLSLTCVFGPLAIITAIMAFREIKQDPTKTGIGRAWFGLIMGIIGTCALAVLFGNLATRPSQ